MVLVVVDQRETRSPVAKELEKVCEIDVQTLEVADYVVSHRCAFERKNMDDFFKSIFEDRKFFSQIGDMSSSYERPVLIIEGGDPFFSGRKVYPGAIQGILNTIAVSFRCPTLYSLDPADTAKIIFQIAKREQTEERRPFSVHGKRSKMSPQQLKEYVVSSIPDLGPVITKRLLTRFGSVRGVFNASLDELQEVEEVGPATARKIIETVAGNYS
jgi:Fanconi anemia group M protein